ncbi:integrase catalytic domain-containing protein [Nephila pilipes]|uniref:Integrase catalytic domain-containing protein n=1 Tax=Nephila pilipes TaxID=299642 RepID=A0A8X6QL28_NEPPI|nr:integrase catalytic domain-containing protein [Nephila pilipes]
MNLRLLGEESANHGLFGGIILTESHQRYQINPSNVNGSYNCELKVLNEKKICASLPRMNDDHCLKQLKDPGIVTSAATINEKSCLEKISGKINLLIGAYHSDSTLINLMIYGSSK